MKDHQSTSTFKRMNLFGTGNLGSLFGWMTAGVIALAFSPAPAAANLQLLPTPPDQGAPSGRQRGGATRGDCLAYQDLTALVPLVDGIVWSETASDTPSFFFDIPAPLTPQTPLGFVIQDSNDDYVFHQELAIEADAGIVELAIPTGKAAFTPGETYAWTLSIYCDTARPSASVSVTGTLKRVDSLSVALPEDSLMRVRQYAAVGLWHESIQLAFDLYQRAPGNAEYGASIEALLDQAGLADVPLSAPQL